MRISAYASAHFFCKKPLKKSPCSLSPPPLSLSLSPSKIAPPQVPNPVTPSLLLKNSAQIQTPPPIDPNPSSSDRPKKISLVDLSLELPHPRRVPPTPPATSLSPPPNPDDQLLVQTSDSFAGLLLFAIGFLLFMVSFVRDRDFQSFFAKGCILLNASMALRRVCFERRLEVLSGDWPRQLVRDFMLGASWVLFLVYSWREKYD